MNEEENIQQELDNVYELICSGELINIELAYELMKNYTLDLNNWAQYFVRKSKMGSVSLYNSAVKKLATFTNIGYNMKNTQYTNEKALKYYNENSKLKYSRYTDQTVIVEHGKALVRFQINNESFSIIFWTHCNNSIHGLFDYENYANDILCITSEMKSNNVIEKYNKECSQIQFYLELETFIKKLWNHITYDYFKRNILKNKLEYDWKNKTGMLLTYTYNNRNINVYNFHSHNTKCTVEYWYGKTNCKKVTKSRNLDLLVKDYAELISN